MAEVGLVGAHQVVGQQPQVRVAVAVAVVSLKMAA